MAYARVLDAEGKLLSPCPLDRANDLIAAGKANTVSQDPTTIQLVYTVAVQPHPELSADLRPGEGKRLLLHACCAPCSTYCVGRLGELGFSLTAYWYNPKIHPADEYETRRQSMRGYAERISLPVIWPDEQGDEQYGRSIIGHERRPERCAICYRLRLEETARAACQQGFHAFSTTLLISPYQQQDVLRAIGEELAVRYQIEFYWANMRRGWGERGRLAREYGLYLQQYCGCVWSEREAREARARRSLSREDPVGAS